MFGVLRHEAERLALEGKPTMILMEAAQERIRMSEDLGDADDRYQLNALVRTHLEDWCTKYIKGKWGFTRELIDAQEALCFTFAKPKEAVRFKLTWGGN